MSWELFPLFVSSERDCRELYNTFFHYMFGRIFFLATLHSMINLRPWPGIECKPHAVEAQSLTTGTPVRPPDSFSLIDADLFRLSIVWVLVDYLSGNWSLASRWSNSWGWRLLIFFIIILLISMVSTVMFWIFCVINLCSLFLSSWACFNCCEHRSLYLFELKFLAGYMPRS